MTCIGWRGAAAALLLLTGPLARAVPPPCPNTSWVESPAGDCFLPLHLQSPVTADQALALCTDAAPGSYLPETLDPETNFIVQMVAEQDVGVSRWVWLGLRRPSEWDDFAWPSGAPLVFEYWASGSPSDWPDNLRLHVQRRHLGQRQLPLRRPLRHLSDQGTVMPLGLHDYTEVT
ncbi:hypothetical protein FJT64_024660 [Amphibalanus amphitrite]|uniref:C-type lectin domain-containing protein n=1 Tax=Amphibalanus amphitrite TaxID=1232801 RepID=A0A6A4WBI8_AMPAM|nr:hypothetical protein FJT64_024660 [Amphibalanus amphitrite]